MGPERHLDDAAGAPEDAPIDDEGSQARMVKLEEDVHEIRGALTKQGEVIDAMARDFSRFSTWVVTSLARMMDRACVTYTSYFKTPREYQRRRVRTRLADLVKEISTNIVITEYLVNISKRRAFWSLNEDILKINDSDYQYAISIKEDTAYPCLHSPKTTKETSSIRRIQRRPIRRIEDIVCEDSGRYQTCSLKKENVNTNSLIELRFGVQELLKVINNTPMIDYEVKGVTTRGGKTTTQDAQNNDTNDRTKEPLAPSNNIQTPPIPFPRRLRKEKEEAQQKKFLENLKQLHINLPFIEALAQMPKYAKFLKGLLTNKARLEEACTITMNERCSAVLLNKLPSKEKDPRSFTIPCDIGQFVALFYITNITIDHDILLSMLIFGGVTLGIPTRRILDSRGAIPSKTAADAKTVI
ncbi:hypothetical protein Tco_0588730 [Tanacetum coccineum]